MLEEASFMARDEIDAHLRQSLGQPVFVVLPDRFVANGLARFRGVLEYVDAACVWVECRQTMPSLKAGTEASIEVHGHAGLVRFRADFQAEEARGWTWLQFSFPSQMAVMQRRLHQRRDVRVAITVVPTGHGEALSGMIQNLSASGIALESSAPLSSGTLVHVSFQLEPTLVFESWEADVVRCAVTGDGCYVIALRLHDHTANQHALEDWVQHSRG